MEKSVFKLFLLRVFVWPRVYNGQMMKEAARTHSIDAPDQKRSINLDPWRALLKLPPILLYPPPLGWTFFDF